MNYFLTFPFTIIFPPTTQVPFRGDQIKIRPQKPLSSSDLSWEPQYLEKKKWFLNSKNWALIINIQSPREKNIKFTLKQYMAKRKLKSPYSASQEEDERLFLPWERTSKGSEEAEGESVSLWCFASQRGWVPVVEATGSPRWVERTQGKKELALPSQSKALEACEKRESSTGKIWAMPRQLAQEHLGGGRGFLGTEAENYDSPREQGGDDTQARGPERSLGSPPQGLHGTGHQEGYWQNSGPLSAKQVHPEADGRGCRSAAFQRRTQADWAPSILSSLPGCLLKSLHSGTQVTAWAERRKRVEES